MSRRRQLVLQFVVVVGVLALRAYLARRRTAASGTLRRVPGRRIR